LKFKSTTASCGLRFGR